jgi:RND family efflux transporter MFP subunit
MKKILLALLVVAGLVTGWFWLKPGSASASSDENERPIAKVGTIILQRQAISRTVAAFGIVAATPSGDHAISVPYDCVIRKILVAAGTPVRTDQVLLELEASPEAKLALDSARSVFGLAANTLASAQERYDLKLATKQDLLAAEQAEADAKLRVSSLEARGLGGDGMVRAPASGIVAKLDLPTGVLVPAGTALVTVLVENQLEARLGLEASDVRNVAAGQKVILSSANRDDVGPVAAVVHSAGRALDATTGAAEVRVALPDGAGLLPGEHVVASIEVERKEDALVVPRSAVLTEEDQQVLYVVRNGKAVRREVQPGLATATQVEVAGGGLRPGDAVVVLGNYELEDGMAVEVQAATAVPAPGTKP